MVRHQQFSAPLTPSGMGISSHSRSVVATVWYTGDLRIAMIGSVSSWLEYSIYLMTILFVFVGLPLYPLRWLVYKG